MALGFCPSPPREHFLSRDQGRELLAAAKREHIYLFLLLAMTTGARKCAILDLTWSRVDLDRRRVDYRNPDRPETKKRCAENRRPDGEVADMTATDPKPVRAIYRKFNPDCLADLAESAADTIR